MQLTYCQLHDKNFKNDEKFRNLNLSKISHLLMKLFFFLRNYNNSIISSISSFNYCKVANVKPVIKIQLPIKFVIGYLIG